MAQASVADSEVDVAEAADLHSVAAADSHTADMEASAAAHPTVVDSAEVAVLPGALLSVDSLTADAELRGAAMVVSAAAALEASAVSAVAAGVAAEAAGVAAAAAVEDGATHAVTTTAADVTPGTVATAVETTTAVVVEITTNAVVTATAVITMAAEETQTAAATTMATLDLAPSDTDKQSSSNIKFL